MDFTISNKINYDARGGQRSLEKERYCFITLNWKKETSGYIERIKGINIKVNIKGVREDLRNQTPTKKTEDHNGTTVMVTGNIRF